MFRSLVINAGLTLCRVYDLLNSGVGSHPGGFPSYDEGTRILDHIETMNPLFVARVPTGISYQCRTMWAYFASMAGLESPKEMANLTAVMQLALLRTIGIEEMDVIKRCNTDVLHLDRRAQADFVWLVAHLKAATEHFDQTREEPTILDMFMQTTDSATQRITSRPWHAWSPQWLRNLGVEVPNILKVKGIELKGLRSRANQAVNSQHKAAKSLTGEGAPAVGQTDRSTWLSSLNIFKNDLRGRILITSLHHAREPASLTVGLTVFNSIIDSLNVLMNELNGRKVGRGWGQGGKPPERPKSKHGEIMEESDEKPPASIPALMAHRHLMFMPFVNPDGYVAIKETGNLMIRKNQRPTCTNKATNSTIILNGVDLNRNYDSAFSRDHTLCDAEEYEGEYPFSEPETRAVRRLARLLEPHVALNYHSYGDIWTRPWNCCRGRKHDAKNTAIFKEIHETLDIEHFGSAPELSQLNYTASGEADDWLMAQFGTISMSPEVGGEAYEFYPPVDALQEINASNLQRTLHVMSKAGIELNAQIIRQICPPSGSKSGDFTLSLFNSGLGDTGDLILFLEEIQKGGVEGEGASRFSTFHWHGSSENIEQFSLTNIKSRAFADVHEEITLSVGKDYQVCVRPKMITNKRKNAEGDLRISRLLTDRLLSGCECVTLQIDTQKCAAGAVTLLPFHLDSRLPAQHPCYERQKLDLPKPMLQPVLAS